MTGIQLACYLPFGRGEGVFVYSSVDNQGKLNGDLLEVDLKNGNTKSI
jgi:hypothetical protein